MSFGGAVGDRARRLSAGVVKNMAYWVAPAIAGGVSSCQSALLWIVVRRRPQQVVHGAGIPRLVVNRRPWQSVHGTDSVIAPAERGAAWVHAFQACAHVGKVFVCRSAHLANSVRIS